MSPLIFDFIHHFVQDDEAQPSDRWVIRASSILRKRFSWVERGSLIDNLDHEIAWSSLSFYSDLFPIGALVAMEDDVFTGLSHRKLACITLFFIEASRAC